MNYAEYGAAGIIWDSPFNQSRQIATTFKQLIIIGLNNYINLCTAEEREFNGHPSRRRDGHEA
jgi:hypothetical protein